jgi:hypothetical protein
MNRCISAFCRQAFFAASLLSSALLPAPAVAQTVGRPIPTNAERGTLVVTQPPNVLLNGHAERLSPGARIRGTNNLLVLSGTLVGQQLPVRYVREPQGGIHEVWILTEAEARRGPGTSP